jgi:hypothetical protein
MSAAFEKLSDESKLQKIRQHIGDGWPVPAPWVQWLLDHSEMKPKITSEIDTHEAALRDAHTALAPHRTFQAFVDGARRDPSHPLHNAACRFNRLCYEIAANWV